MAAQWTYVASPTSAELRGLSLAGQSVIWASGARGTVVRSVDGGRTWSANNIASASGLDLRAIHALSDAVAYTASAGEAEKGLANIFATGDAGRHWNRIFTTSEPGVFIDAIAFWDSHHGIALSDPVNGAFVVLVTADGGRTWKRIPATQAPHVLPGEAAFAASGSAMVVAGNNDVWIATGGNTARVFHSADRGQTWRVGVVPLFSHGQAAGVFSLSFYDTRRGVAVGGDYTQPRLGAVSVALTFDGGRSWRAAEAPPAAYLSGVAFAGTSRDVVAVGLAGTFVSRDGGDSWIQTDSVPLNAVRFYGRTGVAVGPGGRIARSDGVR